MGVSGTLFLVPTPIGDLADLAPRAREVLSTVDRIAAEDTRVTRRLLAELGLPCPPIESYHDHNELERAGALCDRIEAGERVALVSDAGTPLVSDPGYRLVTEAVRRGLRVVPLPGPCAAVVALSAAGLPPDRFLFLGFLPRDPGPRAAALAERRSERATLVFYEAPHRLVATLRAMREAWGDRRVAVARSVTKVWEEFVRGPLSEVEATFAAEDPIRGELTVVVEGDTGPAAAIDERISRLVAGLVAAGVPVATVRDVVAEVYDLPRRDVYQLALDHRRGPPEESG